MALVGSLAKFTATFRVLGVATDPTTVTFKLKAPDGTETSYVYETDDEVERDGEGIYSAAIVWIAPGRWWESWVGTGACAATDEKPHDVKASKFTGEV